MSRSKVLLIFELLNNEIMDAVRNDVGMFFSRYSINVDSLKVLLSPFECLIVELSNPSRTIKQAYGLIVVM